MSLKNSRENSKLILELIREQDDRLEQENSFRAFVKAAWHTVEPGVPYVHGWHIDAICDHLQATADGDIRKLGINISPRSSKSTICSIMFPAWVWCREKCYPHNLPGAARKFLYSSFDLRLSLRDSRKCRMLIGSRWYQKQWGNRVKIQTGKSGQDAKVRFDNDQMGYRIATAVDAGTTGDGGDVLVYDDLNDVKQMNSDAYIEEVIYFHEQVMASRLNDAKTGVRISIQQRSHERDITGHILAKEKGWEWLVIPMEYEGPSKYVTSLGWTDPRTKMGELMCSERLGPVEIEETKTRMGAAGYAGQYQQRPSPVEGSLFKREAWCFWNPRGVVTGPVEIRIPGREVVKIEPVELPVAFEQTLHSWDFAFKDLNDSDYVAGHRWGRVGANTFLLNRRHGHMDFPKSLAAVRAFSAEFPDGAKLIEDKANGPAIIQTLRNEVPGLIAVTPDGGKKARANAVAPYQASRNVYLPNPNLFPWVWEFIEETANFPRVTHDDDTDAMTQALRVLYDSISNSAVPEFRVLPRQGEVSNASHVKTDEEVNAELNPLWRRWVAVAPGHIGAVLWFCETPSGALRVYRELHLQNADAAEAGRLSAALTIRDIRAYQAVMHVASRCSIDILMEKEMFVPIEPVGSYAELFEHGLLSWEPTEGDYQQRQIDSQELKQARISSHIVTTDDASWDRLRDLLRFKPADYEEMEYDRKTAFTLAKKDIHEYARYMDMVEGRITGEWPKIKFAASCTSTISALGAVRKSEEITDPFLRALLLGVSAPPALRSVKMSPGAKYGIGANGNMRPRLGGRRLVAG